MYCSASAPGISIPVPAVAVNPVVVSSVPGGDGGPRSATINGGAGKPSVTPSIAKSFV